MSKSIPIPSIYCILNIENDRRYVGSTSNIRRRRSQHFHSLKKGNHYSPKMQEDYNLFGENKFKFFVLEEVNTYDRSYLYSREQYWMDKLHPCYNVSLVAGDIFPTAVYTDEWKEKIRIRMTGRKQSQEEKDKRAESIKAFWKGKKKIISKEQREKLRQANLGENNPNYGVKRSIATRQKQSDGLSYMEYCFLSPSQEVVSFCNLSTPKIDRGDLPGYSVLRSVIKSSKDGKEHTSGWRFLWKRNVKRNDPHV